MGMPAPHCANSQPVLPALLGTLDFFAEAGGSNRIPIARILLTQLHSNFVVHLEIMKVILGLCAGIIEALQSPELTLDQAQHMICSVTGEIDPQAFPGAVEQ